MRDYMLRRLAISVLVAAIISMLVFGMIHFIPGDPITAMFGDSPDPVAMATIRSLYGLDKPVPLQYLTWLGNLAQGSLGQSFRLGLPVSELVLERVPRSLLLALGGILISLVVALPAGIISARRQNTWVDMVISTVSLAGLSVPAFWLGLLLIILFAVQLRWLPATGFVEPGRDLGGWLRTMLLPCVTLGVVLAASTTRILRSSLLEVMRQDFVTVAHSKGLRDRVVMVRHTLPNALIPTITVLGIQFGHLLGGAIVVERVFAYPGMGLLLIQAISERDYPLIQAGLMVFAVCFLVINLITDLAYVVIDPRIRYT